MSEPRGLSGAYFWVMAVIVLADQATKIVVDRWMALHESLEVIEGFLRLTYVRNRGAAFGILSDAELPYQAALFSLLSLGALVAIGGVFIGTGLAFPACADLPADGEDTDLAAQALPADGQVCITLQRGTSGAVADTTIWQNAPGWNDSTATTLWTGNSSSGGPRHTALRFDLAVVPTSLTVL